jgi:hypothetical protein
MSSNDPSLLPFRRLVSPRSAFNANRPRHRGGSSGSSRSDVIHLRQTPSAPVISHPFQILSSSEHIDHADMLDALDQYQSGLHWPRIATLDPSPYAQSSLSTPALGFDFERAFETTANPIPEFSIKSKVPEHRSAISTNL